MYNRPPNRRQSGRRATAPRRLSISPRDLSIRHPALAENIRRFRVIHESAARRRKREEERVGLQDLLLIEYTTTSTV